MRRKTTEQFVQELVEIFVNSFVYDEIEYINSKTKVKIFCKKCKRFFYSKPDTLLKGCGCGFCNGKGRTTQDILELFYKKHGDKFLYYPFSYKCEHDKIKIRCNKCGCDFLQSIKIHLQGHGCPYCAGQRVWKGYNDLATTHPALLAEWSDKNSALSPESITYKNRSNVWWHCSKCGNDYQAVVYSRANGRICPFCIANGIKQAREQRLMDKQIAKDFNYFLAMFC